MAEPNGILSTKSNKVIEDFSLKSGITSTIIVIILTRIFDRFNWFVMPLPS